MKSTTHTSLLNRPTGVPVNNTRIGRAVASQTSDGDSTKSLPSSSLLSLPRRRHNRKSWSNPIDPNPLTSYGDSILQKDPTSIRIFLQNVHGLTITPGLEEFHYYLQSLKSYHVDFAGLVETNTCWQHSFLQADFKKVLRKYFQQSRAVFGSPSPEVDKCGEKVHFQPGGSVSLALGSFTSSSYREPFQDSTGLGRWCGFHFRGASGFTLSIISAYRTCGGTIATAPIGSTFSREYNFFKEQGLKAKRQR